MPFDSPIRLSNSSKKDTVYFWVLSGIAIIIIFVGWLMTISGVISDGLTGVKQQASVIGEASSEAKEETAASRAQISETLGEVKEILSEELDSTNKKQQAFEMITENIQEQIEENK